MKVRNLYCMATPDNARRASDLCEYVIATRLLTKTAFNPPSYRQMGRKKRAHRTRLQNLLKARLKRARNREEESRATLERAETPHVTTRDSEENPQAGAGLNSDNAGASSDITELTPLEHFSSILQSAQIRAAEAEVSRKKRAQPSHYTGKSERTIRRRKKALMDLQAQGFHTLPDFFVQKAEEAVQKAKMEAILRLREEEEESSGTETTTDKCNSKIVSQPDTFKGMLEPSCSIPPR